jgi:hypothetical protein
VTRDEDPAVSLEEVGERGVVEDGGGCVPYLQEELEEAGVAGLGPHAAGQLGGVAERGERPVEEPHDVPDDDLGGRPAKAVAAHTPPQARHDPGVLEGQEDRLEELPRNPLPRGDLVSRHGSFVPPLGEVEERLEGVEAALRYLQKYSYGNYRIFEPAVAIPGGGSRFSPVPDPGLAMMMGSARSRRVSNPELRGIP